MFLSKTGMARDIKILSSFHIGGQECIDDTRQLSRGATPYEGFYHWCNNGRWSTWCSTHWSTNDVKFHCRELGFSDDGK